jgi:hypothetical protein
VSWAVRRRGRCDIARVYRLAGRVQYGSSNPNSEIRRPKEARIPNAEFRRRKPGRSRSSALVLRISFGFRASEFGLQVHARAGHGCVSAFAHMRTVRLLPSSGAVWPASPWADAGETGLPLKSHCGPANRPDNESRDMKISANSLEAQSAAGPYRLPSTAAPASPGRTRRPGRISGPTYDPTINPQMTARDLQPAPSLQFEKGTSMNTNPYPNGRWTSPSPIAPDATNNGCDGSRGRSPHQVPAARGGADAGRAIVTSAARPSCLDISPRKWLRAPVAPDMLASALHELFWGTPDSDMVSEARARIERVIQRAMEQTDFFRRQEAAHASPAC